MPAPQHQLDDLFDFIQPSKGKKNKRMANPTPTTICARSGETRTHFGTPICEGTKHCRCFYDLKCCHCSLDMTSIPFYEDGSFEVWGE